MVAACGLCDERLGFVEGQYFLLVRSRTAVKIPKDGCVVWDLLGMPV